MQKVNDFLDYSFSFSQDISISVKAILLLILILIIASVVLNTIRRIITRKLPKDDGDKFSMVFSYGKWLVYVVIFLITLHSSGVNVTAIFAASAALLIGVGLALQTFFQDIISGIFILTDQSVHVGDIIEIDGKVGRVEEINLRTTRAVTVDNKVLIIPNHLYLTRSLYNWTQNGSMTRENISIGVAYGSDLELVKKILMQAAHEHPSISVQPEPIVLFTDFGDSALNFKLIFTMEDSFMASIPKSDLRFRISELFKEHNISIPFPQRDVHIYQKSPILRDDSDKNL